MIDQVHGGREANTENLKATQAYQRPKLTMTTTYNKTALFSRLFRATTLTEDSPFHPI